MAQGGLGVFSGVLLGKGGVAELFTKQLCFIGSHKVVQYLVNCFSDNRALPAFWKQMGDMASWITHFLRVSGSFRIGISTTSKGFTLYHHAISQDRVCPKRLPVIGR